MKKCALCKKLITNSKRIKWDSKQEIHLECYTQDKQKDWDVKAYSDCSNENSPYWNWVRTNSFRDDSGDLIEFPEANPDTVSNDASYWNTNDEENADNRKALTEKFAKMFNRLTRRQRKVMFALERYKTEARTAKVLGITQQVVSKTLKIVRKKLLQLGVFSENDDNK